MIHSTRGSMEPDVPPSVGLCTLHGIDVVHLLLDGFESWLCHHTLRMAERSLQTVNIVFRNMVVEDMLVIGVKLLHWELFVLVPRVEMTLGRTSLISK